MQIAVIVVLVALVGAPSKRERVFMHGCSVGAVFATKALGADAHEYAQTLAHCMRARDTGANGGIAAAQDVEDFGCGFALSATFVRLGRGTEVQPNPSDTLMRLADACGEKVRERARKDPIAVLQTKAPVGSCWPGDKAGGVVRVTGHVDGAVFVQAWSKGAWDTMGEFIWEPRDRKPVPCPPERQRESSGDGSRADG
jgi:hypothetical protein